MNAEIYTSIMGAFHEGRKSDVVRLINRLGANAIGDSHITQVMALSQAKAIDERTLLEYAAFDGPVLDPQALFNLGVCEQGAGNEARALLCYAQALRLDPANTGALNNLSDLLRRQGRSEEAWQAIVAYLQAGAAHEGLEIRIAKIADDVGLPQEAAIWFERAMAATPDNPGFEWEWAMQALRDEDFALGWPKYEARKSIFDHDALAIVRYSAPEWDGTSLKNKTLLVHKEQGLGDSIMFASCLAELTAKAAKVHVAVQPPLARLFKHSFPKVEVWPSASRTGAEGEEFQSWRSLAGDTDLQIPLGSLPLYLRTKNPFPKAKPFLHAIDAEAAIWRERVHALKPACDAALRAGLVISARRSGQLGPGIAEGEPKCLPPRLAGGFAHPMIAWFGLHDLSTAHDLAEVPKLDVVDTSPWLYDLADTAALIANLDVVVAVDTAVAHLAGAMGKKVLLMLRRHSDWRWGRNRTDSYWYPDVEVFRQKDEGVWSPVIESLSRRLHEIANDHFSGHIEAPTGAGE